MSSHYVNPSMSIQTLFDSLNPNEAHTVYIVNGVYREKLKLSNDNVTLIGEDQVKTQLTFNDYSYKMHDDGLLYNTFRTATLTITGKNCKLKNLSIINDSGFGPTIGQAIALSIYGDQTVIEHCLLHGYQDTLFIGPLPVDLTKRYAHILPLNERQPEMIDVHLNDSIIEGNIDFIFGSGTALFNHCQLIFNGSGYLAAPSTYEGHLGFVFNECQIVSLDPKFKTILARPWREFGKSYFINCQIDSSINQTRYETWDKSNFDFAEYPAVKHELSRVLSQSELDQLLALFNK